MGSEFPIMNYIVFLLYKLFGVHWWQGRLVNLLMSSIGSFYFYKIIDKFIDKKIAFNATIILIVSIWFAHSRKFMPDVFSTSLVIIGVFYGISYLKEKANLFNLILFSIFISLGLLSKLPSFVMVAFLTPFIFDKTILIKHKVIFVITSILSVIPALWWYFYWVPYLTGTYGFYYFFMGGSISDGLHHLINEWQNILKRFYSDAIQYSGFILFIFGLFKSIKNKKFFLIILFSILLEILFIIKGVEKFSHLTYYIVSFVPFMAFMSSYGIENIKIKWIKIILLLVIISESILNQQHDFMIKRNDEYLLKIENIIKTFNNNNKCLVAVNGTLDPSFLYFTHHKGWTFNSSEFKNEKTIDNLFKKNCQLIIWDKHREKPIEFIKHYQVIYNDNDFKIWTLKKHQPKD